MCVTKTIQQRVCVCVCVTLTFFVHGILNEHRNTQANGQEFEHVCVCIVDLLLSIHLVQQRFKSDLKLKV